MKPDFFSIIVLFVTLISCQKEHIVIPQAIKDRAEAVRKESSDTTYQPVSAGSYWRYKIIDGLGEKESISTTTVSGNVSVEGRIRYYEVEGIEEGGDKNSITHFRRAKNIYSLRGPLPGIEDVVDIDYLHSYLPTEGSWEANFHANGVSGKLTGTILQKGQRRLVGALEFNNVIHTRVLLQYDLSGEIYTWATYDFYIAKGIGIIETHTQLDLFGLVAETRSELIEYSIKK